MNDTPAPTTGWTRIAHRLPPALLWAGLSCGVLDICAAFVSAYVQASVSPYRVLQAVASAVLGRASYEWGIWSAGIGLGLHFGVAFAAAAGFYALSRRWPVLVRQAIPAGLLYGAAVYFFMTFLTVPFTGWFRSLYLNTPVIYAPRIAWAQFGIHLVFVGLAISLAVRRFTPRSPAR